MQRRRILMKTERLRGVRMFVDKSIMEFVSEAASGMPVPGGGGVSALAGALGVALGNMVGELTVGKARYADVEGEIRHFMEKAGKIQAELLSLIEEDAKAFEPLARAYGIPKDDPARVDILEKATRDACLPPLAIVRACAKAMDLIRGFASKGSRLAISDAGCAAVLCKAAMQAAALNVYINTRSMMDRDYAEQLNAETGSLLEESCRTADEVYKEVKDRLIS